MYQYILQTGNVLTTEKIACLRTDNRCLWSSYSNLFDNAHKLLLDNNISEIIPVGTVEFCRTYSEIIGLNLPDDFSYGNNFELMLPFLKRKINKTTFALAKEISFIKPIYTKVFTGDLKSNIKNEELLHLEVWESEAVEFTSEYRFYIHRDCILGYSRYDNLDCASFKPDFDMIYDIIKIQKSYPIAYSIDIGWRKDIDQWCLIELNDAWALGFYNNSDKESKPPTCNEYAFMIAERWKEIVNVSQKV